MIAVLQWPIRFCRRTAAYFTYFIVRIGLPLHVRLVGYKWTVMGRCTILAPQEQMCVILEGITFLQTVDPEMFHRLTAERRYVFWYHPKKFLQCREFFSITDNFLLWGKEGVVTCFVQSVLDLTLKYLPAEGTLVENRQVAIAARREIQRELLKWISEHSFPPELVKQYEEIAEKWDIHGV